MLDLIIIKVHIYDRVLFESRYSATYFIYRERKEKEEKKKEIYLFMFPLILLKCYLYIYMYIYVVHIKVSLFLVIKHLCVQIKSLVFPIYLFTNRLKLQ